MANVDCYGALIGSRGATIPLANTLQVEGTLDETPTDSNYVGSQQSAGTYGDQLAGGFTLVSGGIVAENEIAYCFVRSAGTIKAAIPVGSSGLGGDSLPAPLPYPKRLVSGDQIMTMANTAADREVGLSVACTSGEYHCFSVSPAAPGEHELVSVLTGLSIGETLQGRQVSHAFVTAGNNNLNFTSPVYILDGSGIPTAACLPNDTSTSSCEWHRVNAQITLNSRATFRTDA